MREVKMLRPQSLYWVICLMISLSFVSYAAAQDKVVVIPLGSGGGGGGGILWSKSGNDIYYNQGLVGIGTAPSAFRLTVMGTPTNLFPIKLLNSDGGSNLYFGFGSTTGSTYSEISTTSGDLVFQPPINGAVHGNVGIGITDPSGSLHIRDIYPDLSLEGTAASQRWSLNIGQTGQFYLYNDTGGSTAIRVEKSGNVGIGTTAHDWKLEVAGAVMLEDLASTPTHQTSHSGIYSVSQSLYAIDGAGNSTLLSPHDKESGEWIYYSKNVKTGRIVQVDMERMVRAIEKLTGETFMMEKWEKE